MEKLSYYFEQNFLEQGTANVVHSLNSCDAFMKNGVEVTMYATMHKNTKIEHIRNRYGLQTGFAIRRMVRFPYIKYILNALVMFCYLLKDDNTVITTRNFYFVFLASYLNKVVIMEAHQYAFDQWYHNMLFPWILKAVAAKDNVVLVVNCGNLKDKFREMGVDAPILVCHNGYDADKAHRGGCVFKTDRAGYKAIAMYAGSLNRIKGLEHIEHLAAGNPDVGFYLVGDEHYHSDKDIVDKLRDHGNVFFTGRVDHHDVHSYLSQADILLVLPTRDGVYNDVTSPIKMFEYMSAGRAILATDMPSVKEILKDGVNALLASDEKDDVARRFRTLVEDVGLRDKLGERAVRDSSIYTWKQRAASIIEHLSCRYQRKPVRELT